MENMKGTLTYLSCGHTTPATGTLPYCVQNVNQPTVEQILQALSACLKHFKTTLSWNLSHCICVPFANQR